DSLTLLSDQQSRYREEVRREYVDEKTTEDPDFSYEESRDDAAVAERVNQRLVDFLLIEGQIHYYIALGLQGAERQEEARIALRLFDETLKALQARGQIPGFEAMRAQLNRARTLLLLQDTNEAIRDLRELADETYEYNALREYWATYRSLGDAYKQNGNLAEAERQYAKSLDILKEFPDLRYRLGNRLDDYFDSLAAFFVSRKQPLRAMEILELKRQNYLQRQFLRYPLKLANGIEDEQHRVIMQNLDILSRSSRRESLLRLEHRDADDIASYNSDLRRELSYVINSLAEARPLLRPFLITEPGIPRPKPGTFLVQFFSGISPGCFRYDGRAEFLPMQDRSPEEFVLACLPDSARELVVVPDHRSYSWKIHQIIQKNRPDLPRPVYTTTVRDLQDALGFLRDASDLTGLAPGRNLFNALPSAVPQSNRLLHEDAPAFEIFAGREDPGFDLRNALAKGNNASILFLSLDTDDPLEKFQSIRNAYEVFRASGGATLALLDSTNQADTIQSGAGKEPYNATGIAVFGVTGFEPQNLQNRILQDALESEAAARAALDEEDNPQAAILASRSLSLRKLLKTDGLGPAAILNRALARQKAPEGSSIFEDTLALAETPQNALLLYSERIRGLYEAGEIEPGNRLSADFGSRYPELSDEMRKRLNNYLALAILDSSASPAVDLKQSNLSGSPEDYLQSERDRQTAALSMIKHGATDRVENMLARQFDIESRKLYGEAMIQGALLQKGNFQIPPSVESDTSFLLAESLSGRWKFFDDIVRNLPSTAPEEVGQHRRQLLYQWKNSRLGNPISFEQLRCIPVKEQDLSAANAFTAIQRVLPDGREITDLVGLTGSTESSCLYLSSVDRALMFHLLIQSVDVDPGLQIAAMLDELIQAEAGFSRARASWFALVASEYYLNKMDPDTGYRFYALHLNYRDASLESDEVRRGRLALWYRLYDKPISDPLLGEFMNVKPVRQMADMIIGLPRKPDRRDYDKIVRELEKGKDLPDLQRERSVALDLLKRRAIQDNNWKTLANLEFYRDRILGATGNLPPMEDLAGEIIRTIPRGQTMTVLVDAGETFYSIVLSSGGLEQRNLGVNAREMRANLEEFRRSIQQSRPNPETATSLSDFYRSILPGSTGSPHYFWFPAQHALAPIIPRTGDQLYQVLDPAAIASSSPYEGRIKFEGDFRVLQSGRPGAYPGMEPDLYARMRDMELSALDNTTLGSPLILHHFSGGPHDPLYSNRNLPFFFSDAYLVDLNQRSLREFFTALAKGTDAPGVLTLARPPGTAHAFFVKNFYDRTLPRGSLPERYVHAFALMIRNVHDTNSVYGYRLVTSRWVASD
ncbi:MAG: tetratricopeptide repeat protein, partial [Leptospiraceae bacterium]|nr:tetratricopeptide repeat protein [Leptospiraceae bacterium]